MNMNLLQCPTKGFLVRKNTRSWMSTQTSLNIGEVMGISSQFVSQPSQWIPEWNSVSEQIFIDFHEPVNMFCPQCGRQVQQKTQKLYCRFKKTQKLYLSHQHCIMQSKISLTQNLSELKIAQIKLVKPSKPQRILALGQKQYLVQLLLMHPLSSFIYFKGQKRLIFNGRSIIWELSHEGEQNHDSNFQPNFVCIPTKQFKIVVNVVEISTKNNMNKKTLKLLVDLGKKQPDGFIYSASWKQFEVDFNGQFNLITQNQQKAKKVQEMNFKYRYPTNTAQDMVQVNRIQIQIRDDNDLISQISSVQKSPIIQDKISDFPIENNWQWKQYQMNPEYENMNLNTQISNEDIPMILINEVDRLIMETPQKQRFSQQYENLKEYVCSHAGSKQFQKNIQHMKPHQVDQIIRELYYDFPQLIVHQYANYMFQSLIIVCSLSQRLNIIETLKDNLKMLACNKQGTFSLQQFISFLTSDEQFSRICNSIKSNFIQIAMDTQGTHFIRKLVKVFPIKFVLIFSDSIIKNFMKMAVDKNAICVLKALINSLQNAKDNEEACEFRKKIIHQMSLNTDKIIQDQFGNYLIQQVYEVFGEERLKGISQVILQKFAIFSIQKFSSNVILKCIKQYWKDVQLFQRLRQFLKNNDIITMYKNRQGNKVLLQLISISESPLEQKIQNSLWNQDPSRFNTEKWLNAKKRSSTGTVGTTFKNFSDAINQSPMKKKHYH